MIPDNKKSHADNLPLDEDQIYDQLVDGELDNDRRQTLLGSLDSKPGGWRRCALAFLEAQSWGEEFNSLSARLRASSTKTGSDTSATPKSVPGKKSSSSKPLRKVGKTGTILGMAASFLLAMGITSWVRDLNRDMGFMSGGMEAGIIGPSFGRSTKPRPNTQIGTLGLDEDAPNEMYLFTLSGKALNGEAHSVGLPAVSQKNWDEQQIREMPTAIPDGVVQSFQQAGHNVKTSRQLLPFRMKDGRTLVIPVDQVDVQYDTTPYYQ